MGLIVIALFCFMAAFKIGFIDAFRSDYTYIESTRSYYKFHRAKATWPEARAVCQSEEAVLFHPDHEPELAQVLSTLAVGNNEGWLLITGIADLGELGVYETVDGRPISRVYNNWQDGEPTSGSNNQYRCGRLNVETHKLIVHECDGPRTYICKHHQNIEEVVTTATGGVKTIIATAGDKQTTVLTRLVVAVEAMQRLAANQGTVMQGLAANQAAALERQTKAVQQQDANQVAALDRQTEAMKRLVANQATALDKLTEAMQGLAANQTAALDRQAEAIQQLDGNQAAALDRQTKAMQQQDANQAAALDRQTKAMQQQDANQAAALNRHTEAMQQLAANQAATLNQAEAMQRLAVNQTAASERQAIAMEKLANLQDDNSQLDIRSQQQ